MHQQIEDAPQLLVITDDTTKAEIEEAMRHTRASLDRLPSHYLDRRARLHARLDALLTDWERAPDPRVTADA